ncbi:MAG: Mpo1-like protein [Halopseudomonas sabulinigri]|tara:strand:+ start:6970 stop:7299 length:330 start_codon:yes stop_codon:yes gene_type:complete
MSSHTNQAAAPRFNSFAEFYPYYLSEHQDDSCRRLHYVGSSLVLIIIACVLLSQAWWWLLAVPLAGYSFAWVGHFFFEHNRPATFTHPFYSLLGDWVMMRDAFTGRIRF